MRVLIVEDDAALGKFLQKGLQLDGHLVELATDGQTGLERALFDRPDLLVLDLGLPKMDGIEVLERLQTSLSGMSVLILTGRSTVEERVRCLNLGADDCLLKPFAFSELKARCNALLRRREQFADPVLRVGAVELNRMDRKVTREGQSIELTAKEYALLEYLMQARGRICTRTELLREVWQMSPDAGTNVVDVYVNYLRKKLSHANQTGMPDREIETIRGEGYAMTQGLKKGALGVMAAGVLQAAMRGPSVGVFGMGGGVANA